MIELQVDQASVNRTIEYLQAVRLKIFENVLEAMQAGKDDLAVAVVMAAVDQGIQARTGKYFDEVLASASAGDIGPEINCSVEIDSTMGMQAKHIGIWLSKGFHDPAVKLSDTGQRRKYRKALRNGWNASGYMHKAFCISAGGSIKWASAHKAFDVRPRPFPQQALEAWLPSFLETVKGAIAAAVEEAHA